MLDVACGTGLVTLRAASTVGERGKVMAVDLSDEMVRDLEQNAAEQSLSNVIVKRMDAQELALPDGTYDAALCAFGLMYVPDPLAALKEMKRALRAGGRAVMAVWGARDKCGWAEIFPIVERRVESDVCPLFFQLGTADALALNHGAGGVHRDHVGADEHHAPLRLGIGCVRRGVRGGAGGARIFTFFRLGQSGGSRRISGVHRGVQVGRCV